MTRSVLRSVALLASACVLSLSCKSDSTGPAPQGFVAVTALFQSEGAAVIAGVTKVHVVFTRTDGTVARDTVLTIAAIDLATPLVLQVPLDRGKAASGEDFTLLIELMNDAGQVLFRAGPVSVVATTELTGPGTSLTASYVGPGADAIRLEFPVPTMTVLAGAIVDLFVNAFDANDQPVANAFVTWSVENDDVASIADPGVGQIVAGGARGTTTIRATLITGQFAELNITVQPPATMIEVAAGANQTVTVGTAAPAVISARVRAADGIGVGGVDVAFTVASGGGTLSSALVSTNSDGIASVSYSAGSAPGDVVVNATATGLAGSPASFPLTVVAGAASNLAFLSQPVSGVAGGVLPPLVVELLDALGNRATGFSGAVMLALDTPPAGVTLLGTTTVNAVAGVATFPGVRVSAGGTALRIRATAVGVVGSALSSPFNMAIAQASDLVITTVPTLGVVGQLLRIVGEARTADGIIATEYPGTLLVTILAGATGGAISINDRAAFMNGVATLDFGLTVPGNYELLLTAPGLPQRIVGPITVATANIQAHSGDGQNGPAMQALPQPVIARVTSNEGVPLPGVEVLWDVIAGGGSITPINQFTDANGFASATWVLGAAGPQTAQAGVAGGALATFDATVGVPAPVASALTSGIVRIVVGGLQPVAR